MNILGIRREDKNKWERRAPLVPQHVKALIQEENIDFIIETSKIRVFSDEEFASVGAEVKHNLARADVILAIKEIPVEHIEKEKTYIFFSHTIKGQKHNMPLL